MINTQERQLRKYKNDFTVKFAEMMSSQVEIWKSIQKQERKSLYSWNSILTYIGISLLGYIPGKHEHNYSLEAHFWISVGFFIFAVITNIITTNKTYQNKIKGMLFPKLIKVFGDEIYYKNGNGSYIADYLTNSFINKSDIAQFITDMAETDTETSYRISDNVFRTSELYVDKTITQRDDDDIFYGKYNGIEFIMNETDFGWNSNDKHRTYHRMFKGVAMHFKLNKNINSRVLIRSKRIFSKIPKGFEKVNVEYNKFSHKYDVYVKTIDNKGSGQIEARYLLNTVFLDKFMQLHTSFNVPKIECSIYGENMLIMLSTNKDLFEMNHLFGRIDDVKQYNNLFNEFASVLSFIDVLNLSSKTKL